MVFTDDSVTRIMNRFRTRIGPLVPGGGWRKPFPVTFFWLTQSSVLGIFSGRVSIVCAESDFCFTFRLFRFIKTSFQWLSGPGNLQKNICTVSHIWTRFKSIRHMPTSGCRCRPIRADMLRHENELEKKFRSLSTFLGFETVFFWSCFLRFWSVLASLMVSSNGFILFSIHQKYNFIKWVNLKLISRKKVFDFFIHPNPNG